MTDEGPMPSDARTRALIALARIELDDDPATWPTSELGRQGTAAAALVTGRWDTLPTAGVGSVWREMPRALRTLVRYRNPAVAV
jgi:hypothetical protein